jgi:PAS domain S-box-containing protein
MDADDDTRRTCGPEAGWHRLVVEHTQDLIGLLDDQGRLAALSPSCTSALGYAREELIGRRMLDLVSAADQEPVRRSLAGGQEPFLAQIRRADGRYLDVEGRSVVTGDHEGRRTLVVLRDVSERTRVERRRDTQYAVSRVLATARTLAEAAPEVLHAIGTTLDWETGSLWLVDGEAEMLRCIAVWHESSVAAPAFAALTRATTFRRGIGLPGRVWASGKPAWSEDVTGERNFPRRDAAASDGLHGGFAFPIASRGDVAGVVELFSHRIRARDEDLLQATAALGEHIGQFVERVRAEEEVRAGQTVTSAIIESALDCVITMDHRGVISEFNPAAERTFGYARGEVIGRELAAVVVPPSLRERHRRGLARYLASGESELLGGRIELLGMRADGSEFPVELTVTRIDVAGAPMFTGYIRDLTERRQAEAALLEAQRLEAVGRLSGGIAHDFNNLLAVIGGFAELALRQPGASGSLRVSLQEIARASEQGAELTGQLLAFSRGQPVETTVVSVNRLIAELDAILRRLLGEDLRLITVFGATRGLVEANRGQLQQVLVNLAVNARDAMPDGGKLTIETEETELDAEQAQLLNVEPGPYVVIRVTDTGRGMDPETQRRVFEPFFTTKPRGQGTGLGLSTLYGIVTGSGGCVDVDSRPGHGTSFTIRLPAARADADEPSMGTTPLIEPSHGTVLLVEDNASLRLLARHMLEEAGYTVLAASSGDDALSEAEKHDASIEVLVTDVVMPGMRGPELAARLTAARPQMRVLFISGYSEDLEYPAGAFLAKPFKREALIQAVAGLLESARGSDSQRQRFPRGSTP